LDADNIQTQLVSGGFDRQYFHNHVDEHLRTILNLERADFIWGPVHRFQLAEKDTRQAKVNRNGQEIAFHGFCNKVINTIFDVLQDVRFGRKFEHLLDTMERFPDEKHPHLDTFSHTRFCPYSARVFKAFLMDLKPIVTALEERSKDFFDEKDADTAQSLLNAILSIKFMSDLAGLTDIYSELSALSLSLQKVSSVT